MSLVATADESLFYINLWHIEVESPICILFLQMSTMEISIKKWENILKHSNAYLPHAIVASTVLALVYPPSFAWFTTK